MFVEVFVAAYVFVALALGLVLLWRALNRTALALEELAFAFACSYLVGGALWVRAWALDESLLGFTAPWTWLTASHFHAAGFGALVVSAGWARTQKREHGVSNVLLLAHPVAFALVALGLNGTPYADALGAVLYQVLFTVQFVAHTWGLVAHWRAASPRGRVGYGMLTISLAVPVVTLALGLAWALGRPLLDLNGMVRYHGIVNAVLHVGLGFLALGILRPAPTVRRLDAPFSCLHGGRTSPFPSPKAARRPLGLNDDLSRFGRSDLEIAALHPDVRAFYERTCDFDLVIHGDWRFPFRVGGWLWSRLVSRALGQLGLPGPGDTVDGAQLDSRLVDIDDAADGRRDVRGWIRTWKESGRFLYRAAYSEHERDGVRFMNIAFPLPGGNLTSVLHLALGPGDGLTLTSRHDIRPDGDQGIFLTRRGRGLRLPMDETIVVTPVTREDPAEVLEAEHRMWLLGLRFLTLHYRLFRRVPF